MRKSIIFICMAAIALSACSLRSGDESGHTAYNLEEYITTQFVNNVVYPAGIINRLIALDDYMAASDEEKKSETFKWHRENIFHEDDVTFAVRDVGTVRTYGKSFFDPEAEWKIGPDAFPVTRIDENTWKIESNGYYMEGIHSTVRYDGKNGKGCNILSVEVNKSDECYISRYSTDMVTAIVTTPEGTMSVVDPNPNKGYGYNYDSRDLPEGSGVIRIDTERNGKPLDWAELRYHSNGISLMFVSNL